LWEKALGPAQLPWNELNARIEEARNSAKLLSQIARSTPPSEVLGGYLVHEFFDRCQSASCSMHKYLTTDDPTPDNETTEALIEASESALNQNHKSILNAKRLRKRK